MSHSWRNLLFSGGASAGMFFGTVDNEVCSLGDGLEFLKELRHMFEFFNVAPVLYQKYNSTYSSAFDVAHRVLAYAEGCTRLPAVISYVVCRNFSAEQYSTAPCGQTL